MTTNFSFNPAQLPKDALGIVLSHLSPSDVARLSMSLKTPKFHEILNTSFYDIHHTAGNELSDLLGKVQAISNETFSQITICRQKIEVMNQNWNLRNCEQIKADVRVALFRVLLELSLEEFNNLNPTAQKISTLLDLHPTLELTKKVHRILQLTINDPAGSEGSPEETNRLLMIRYGRNARELFNCSEEDWIKTHMNEYRGNLLYTLYSRLATQNRVEEAALIADKMPVGVFKLTSVVTTHILQRRFDEAKDLIRNPLHYKNSIMLPDDFMDMIAPFLEEAFGDLKDAEAGGSQLLEKLAPVSEINSMYL